MLFLLFFLNFQKQKLLTLNHTKLAQLNQLFKFKKLDCFDQTFICFFLQYQIVLSICKRLNIPNPQRFALATMRDFVFNENEPLGTYGLGTLYSNWKLKFIIKSSNAQGLKFSFCIFFFFLMLNKKPKQ